MQGLGFRDKRCDKNLQILCYKDSKSMFISSELDAGRVLDVGAIWDVGWLCLQCPNGFNITDSTQVCSATPIRKPKIIRGTLL